jgi:hypothetical protein
VVLEKQGSQGVLISIDCFHLLRLIWAFFEYSGQALACAIHKEAGPTSTKDALATIPPSCSLKVEGADYPILRVFASWPGPAVLKRTLEKGKSGANDPDRHPVATLHLDNFNKVIEELDRDWFQGVGQQTLVVSSKRARGGTGTGIKFAETRKVGGIIGRRAARCVTMDHIPMILTPTQAIAFC